MAIELIPWDFTTWYLSTKHDSLYIKRLNPGSLTVFWLGGITKGHPICWDETHIWLKYLKETYNFDINTGLSTDGFWQLYIET